MGGTMQNLYEGAETFKLPQGLAAQAGVFSAELAGKGFTGLPDPLLSKYGYFALYSPVFDPGILTRELGKRFYSDSTFKIYPCCGASHPTIDCILNLIRDYNIKPGDLDDITINVTPAHLSQPLGQPFKIGDFPQGNAAFNLCYIAASALLRGCVKPEHFTEPFVRDPEVMNLSQRINLTGTIANEKHVTSAEVRVRLKDGQMFQTRVDEPKGHPDNPITKSEIEQKFMDNVAFSRTISTRKARTALDMMNNLEKIKDIKSLVRLLIL
jgi:2-methylcitrate dehydratase